MPPKRLTIPSVAVAARPDSWMAAATPNAAAMVRMTSKSTDARASEAVNAPEITRPTAMMSTATVNGICKATPATITAAMTANVRPRLVGGGAAGACDVMSRKSGRSCQRSAKPSSLDTMRASPACSSTRPSWASICSPARWMAMTAAW